MDLFEEAAAIVEQLGAPRECVAAARALGGDADSIARAARRALGVRWIEGARRSAKDASDAIVAIAGDTRAVVVAIASVLATLRAGRLTAVTDAQQALFVWAPLAARFGLGPIEREIEDRAFQVVDRPGYDAMAAFVVERREERDRAVEAARHVLLAALSSAGVAAEVTGRAKHLFSIHRKLGARAEREPVLHDLFGLRVIVEDEAACYAVLGVIHEAFVPLPARFKDYIARPKASGYRSLHTCVQMADARDLRVEVQIRTRAMHESAEHGASSHLRYKHPGWDEPMAARWIYALTPRGHVRRLPVGATPLDFAYAIHTQIGRRYSGARVNGRMVAAETLLRTGDVVEILCSARARPSAGQLARVCTARARNRIRAALVS